MLTGRKNFQKSLTGPTSTIFMIENLISDVILTSKTRFFDVMLSGSSREIIDVTIT